MAKLVVVSTGTRLTVTFNDYAAAIGSDKTSYHKENIAEIDLNSDHVQVYMSVTNETLLLTWDATYIGSDFFIIDSIDTVAPTSLSDLFDKLTAIM